ncbi:MAG: hypothetical protein NVS2B7_15030 [Herpetosiphon sp.]
MSLLRGISPGVFLSLVLGVVYGGLGHLVLGRRIWQLPLFIGAAVLGCLGSLVTHFQLFHSLPAPGGLPVVEASIVAWVLLSLVGVLRRG